MLRESYHAAGNRCLPGAPEAERKTMPLRVAGQSEPGDNNDCDISDEPPHTTLTGGTNGGTFTEGV
jgi:hypothetical protein